MIRPQRRKYLSTEEIRLTLGDHYEYFEEWSTGLVRWRGMLHRDHVDRFLSGEHPVFASMAGCR